MEIAKITSPHHHITVKACHWDSVRSASTIAHFIICLLSIAVRDIVVLIFTIVWFIWASTAQQQLTIFWHRG
jgi:predicted AlkP superfamily pyrophosphatase or phosphodiesterase